MRSEVLVISRWYPTPEQPHIYPFIRDWALAASRIAEVRVLHLDSDEFAPTRCELVREDDERITHGLETWRLEMGHSGLARTRILFRETAATIRAVRAMGSPPDLLHAHVFTIGPHALACKLILGIPYVVTEHFSRFRRTDFRWYHQLQAVVTLPFASRILVVSQPLAHAMRRKGVVGRYEIIPNPVDTVAFRPTSFPPGETLNLTAVGKLVPHKGTDLLLRAIALIGDRKVKLVVIGDGPCRMHLESLTRSLGIQDRVTFIGVVSRLEVSQRLKDAHALVVPSRLETFSVAAAEALAAGRPVLSTRCGGPETFIGHDEGVVVESGRPDALAEGIQVLRERLLAGEFEPLHLSRSAEEKFSFTSIARRLEQTYERVLDDGRDAEAG